MAKEEKKTTTADKPKPAEPKVRTTERSEEVRTLVPEGVYPVEPSDAGSSTPRTEAPVYPADYDIAGQL